MQLLEVPGGLAVPALLRIMDTVDAEYAMTAASIVATAVPSLLKVFAFPGIAIVDQLVVPGRVANVSIALPAGPTEI